MFIKKFVKTNQSKLSYLFLVKIFTMQLLDGKKLATEIKLEIAEEVRKIKEVGFKSTLFKLKKDITENELLTKINLLNNDDSVDGFIVQLPLPKHINEEKIMLAIAPEKDVDGFHPTNVGRMTLNLPSYVSATPKGILEMLNRYNIETEGKHCVVIGRSNIVDVGITRVVDASTKSGFKLLGDVDFEHVQKKCSYISPVPGGVGLMTVVSLLQNTLSAAKEEFYKKSMSFGLDEL